MTVKPPTSQPAFQKKPRKPKVDRFAIHKDSKVTLKHWLIDVGNVLLGLVLCLIPLVQPTSHLLFGQFIERGDIFMTCVVGFFYTTITYWIMVGYFVLIEWLNLCPEIWAVPGAPRLPVKKVVGQVLWNQFWGGLAITCALAWGWKTWPEEFSATVPAPWTIFKWCLLLALFWSELGFYTTHRLIHTKPLMRFHKVHHEMNHESLTCAWGARYCSLFEDLFVNLFAINFGTFFVSINPLWFFFWVTHLQWNVICNHSGYHEKYLPISAGLTGMIHYHHHQDGRYDFGTTSGWMDWMLGTKSEGHPGSIFVLALDFMWNSVFGDPKKKAA